MKYVFLLLVALLSMGCFNQSGTEVYRPSEKQKLANKILANVALKLRNETELRPCGTGGEMMYEVKMLALSFDYYKSVEIDEVRGLLVKAADALVDGVNSNPDIQQYLYTTPFTPENVEIRIFIKKSDGHDVDPGTVCVAGMIKGVLDYQIDDPNQPLFKTIHEETYAEAIQLLKEKRLLDAKRAAEREAGLEG